MPFGGLGGTFGGFTRGVSHGGFTREVHKVLLFKKCDVMLAKFRRLCVFFIVVLFLEVLLDC